MRPHSLYTRQRSELSRKGMRNNVYEICVSEYPFLRLIIHLRKSVFHLPSPCSQSLWTSPSALFTYKTASKLTNWKGFWEDCRENINLYIHIIPKLLRNIVRICACTFYLLYSLPDSFANFDILKPKMVI